MAAVSVVCYVHNSPIHGRGLFSAHELPARTSLGELVGEQITAAEFARRKAAGGACLVRFTDLDGEEVYLDGEGRCLVAHVNSVEGTGLLPSCEFVSDGQRVEVVTLHAVPRGTELLADYTVRARERAQLRPAATPPPAPPPARAPGAPVLRGSCADFERRLQSAICDGGGFAEREPLAWAAQGSGGANWLAFLACFGAADSVAAAAKAVRFKLPGSKGPQTPRVSELHRLDDPAVIGARVPPSLVAALQRACVASPPVLHVFMGRGAGVEAGTELGWELGGCVLRVLCGALDVWLAAGTVENAQLFGDDPERPASDYARVRRARLEAGGGRGGKRRQGSKTGEEEEKEARKQGKAF